MTIANQIAQLSPAQLQRLTAQELLVLIRGLGVVVQELQGREFETRNFTVLDNVPIRDTNNHDSPELIDLYQAVNFGFTIRNTTDQALTFRLIAGLTGGANDSAPMGDPVTISPHGADCVSAPMDLWLPFAGARASFTTAPTEGAVTVILCRRERRWAR